MIFTRILCLGGQNDYARRTSRNADFILIARQGDTTTL